MAVGNCAFRWAGVTKRKVVVRTAKASWVARGNSGKTAGEDEN